MKRHLAVAAVALVLAIVAACEPLGPAATPSGTIVCVTTPCP